MAIFHVRVSNSRSIAIVRAREQSKEEESKLITRSCHVRPGEWYHRYGWYVHGQNRHGQHNLSFLSSILLILRLDYVATNYSRSSLLELATWGRRRRSTRRPRRDDPLSLQLRVQPLYRRLLAQLRPSRSVSECQPRNWKWRRCRNRGREKASPTR